MFSWICPRCGRENRPSDTECPNCKLLDEQAQAAQPVQPRFDEQPTVEVAAPLLQRPPAPPPVYSQPEPQRYAPPPPPQEPARYAPPEPPRHAPLQSETPRYAPPPPPPPPPPPVRDPLRAPLQHPETRHYVEEPPVRRAGLPTWLMALLFAFAFVGLGSAVYYGYQRYQKGGGAGFTGGETPASAPKSKGSSAVQKVIEVVGIRIANNAKKKPEARFVVVNHSNTELSDLTANVTLWASTSRSEEDAVGTFTFNLSSLGPSEAKEVTTPLKTRLKIYEMPDWQNYTADVQITSQ